MCSARADLTKAEVTLQQAQIRKQQHKSTLPLASHLNPKASCIYIWKRSLHTLCLGCKTNFTCIDGRS